MAEKRSAWPSNGIEMSVGSTLTTGGVGISNGGVGISEGGVGLL
jgi:hypothetical protein